jgi:amidase
VVTRSVRDAAALLDVTAGAMPGDPYTAPPPRQPFASAVTSPPAPLRVGILRGAPRQVETHPECLAAVDRAARLLGDLGHHVEEAHPPALDEPEHVLVYVGIVSANVARAVEAWGQRVGRPAGEGDVEPLTWVLAERGRAASATELLATIESVHAFGRRLASWWDGGFDLLVTPTQAAPPPALGYLSSTPEEPLRAFMRSAPYGACTLPFNMSGQPAISLPLHWTPDGLPIGVQLAAAFGREDLLLAVAAQLEQAAPWSARRPRLHA